jgi:very-short-patch-repair endonuclease
MTTSSLFSPPSSSLASLAVLASEQIGAFTVAQARQHGVDRRALNRRAAAGELQQLTSRVFVFAAVPRTDEQCIVAACLHLGPGAAASHATAAALWGFPGFRLVPIHVIDARSRRRAESYSNLTIDGQPVVVHTSRYLPPHHVVRLGSIDIVTPTRLFFQMAEAGMHPKRVARLVDRGWSHRLTAGSLLVATFDELDVPGRRGLRTMEVIIEKRGLDYVPPESNLEARFLELTQRRGLGPYRRQVDVGGKDWVARVDMLHERLPVVGEIDGDAFHRALTDTEADAARDARLGELGYEVVHVAEFEVWHDPDPALDRLEAAEERARTRRGAA